MTRTTVRTQVLLLAFIFSFQLIFAGIPPTNNDNCANATSLTIGVTQANETVKNMNPSTGMPVPCSGDPDDDVWYKFTPTSGLATISLSSIGTDLSSSGAMIQMFTGSCGSLSSYACGTTTLTTVVQSGTAYYIRIYSAGTSPIGSTSGGSAFSITATSLTIPANDD